MTEAEFDPQAGPLPEVVRSRVVALVAEVLPKTTPLPPSLRKVAAFAPQRRARLGGAQIVSALEDAEFRERVATHVWAVQPDLAESDDPLDEAAVAWLDRPEGWQETFAGAVRRVEESVAPQQDAERDRLARKAEAAEQAVRDLRAEHRASTDQLKAENAALRRKLGEARAAARSASTSAEEAAAAAREGTSAAEATLQVAEAELRRLRAQIEELQTALTAARRDVRVGKDEATVRTRLLLDTLLDAGQGLRRELALPTITGTPGQRLEEEIAEAGTRELSSAGALGPASPALLEQYLAMPKVRLIIDGYNVSMSAWPDSSLEAQRIRLLNGLAPLVARVGAETTVVFDAAAVTKQRPVTNAPRGVKVLFSPEGVIADDVIRDLVEAEPPGRVVVVVTSDGEIARDVVRAGARVIMSVALVAQLARSV